MSALYTVTTYGCREYLCRMGMIAGTLETVAVSPRVVGIGDVQIAVCNYYEIPLNAMTTPCRVRALARPRQVAIYLSKQFTPRSQPEIGRAFGNRHHTTVIHAIRQIEKLREADPEIDADVRRLTRRLAA